jgi:hypothetical protein
VTARKGPNRSVADRGLLGVLVCGLWTAGCLPGDDAAFVRIVDPQPGQRAVGPVKFRFESARPFAFRGYSVAFDDASPSPLKDQADDGALLTTELSNGTHRLRVGMHAWGGRNWEDQVVFFVDNPPQRVVRLENSNRPRPGEAYRTRLFVNLPEVTVRAAALDVPDRRIDDVLITPFDATSVDVELSIPETATYSVYHLTLELVLGERTLRHELAIPVEQPTASGLP